MRNCSSLSKDSKILDVSQSSLERVCNNITKNQSPILHFNRVKCNKHCLFELFNCLAEALLIEGENTFTGEMKALKKGLKSECLLLTFVLIVNSVFSLKPKNILNPNFKNSELKVLKGCPLEDGSIIEFGVSRTLPGCKALRCIKEEISFALILQSCEVTKNDIPPGCKIIPRPELQYPKCCNILLHCEKVTTHVSPVVYTHKNISQLERKDSINKVGINEPQIKEIISSDVIKRNKKEEATRYRRELSSSAKPKTPIVKGVKKIKGCVTEFGFMDIDEEFVLPGCSKARCLETAEGEVALVIFR
ncbi:hypothetical protein Anas_08909 [Armadillidium nasatum]|uniref:Single domain-containing protein n=1 Tax=Armadillidium nasatum TaxID=96803 RepID=A0A5N5SST5_9CRUS|nr:hypothetical protein Anas_08909 [Armadillidium nasatum]